jgi:hypothetical protein
MKQLQRLRPCRGPARRAQLPLGDDRDLAEVAMDIQRYRSHTILLAVDGWENRWANDIDGSALAAQPGKSQGRPIKSPGSNTPIAQNGLPSLRSPEGPCPSRPNLSRPPDDTGAFKEPVSCREQRAPARN